MPTMDWDGARILVAKTDPAMVLIQSNPSEIYQLDMDAFRLALKDLEDDVIGLPYPDTHSHNTTVTVSGAVLARVVQILDPYVVEFEDGQYRVLVVGANTDIAEKTVVNQVSVSTSNSAGLQDLNSLRAASFAGAVAVRVGSIYSGVTFPVGTRQFPVNNFADARLIAENQGLASILVMASTTLDAGTDFSDGFRFFSDNLAVVTLTIDPNADVTNCYFENLTITGTLDGNNVFDRCDVFDVVYVQGELRNCGISGTLTLGVGGQANLVNCHSRVAGGGGGQTPVVNMNGSGNSLLARDWTGGLELTNYSGGGELSLDFDSGRLIVAASVTAGDIYVRGVGTVDDQSTGTAVVYDQTLNRLVGDLGYGRKVLRESVNRAGGVPGYLLIHDSLGTLIGHKPLWANEAQTLGWVQGDSIFYEGELVLGAP